MAKVSTMRKALLEAASPGDVQRIYRAMVRKARKGDVQAANLVLDRVLGKAVEQDQAVRLELVEQLLGLVRERDAEVLDVG